MGLFFTGFPPGTQVGSRCFSLPKATAPILSSLLQLGWAMFSQAHPLPCCEPWVTPLFVRSP